LDGSRGIRRRTDADLREQLGRVHHFGYLPIAPHVPQSKIEEEWSSRRTQTQLGNSLLALHVKLVGTHERDGALARHSLLPPVGWGLLCGGA